MGTALVERTLTQIDYVRLSKIAAQADTGISRGMLELLEASDLVASPAVPPTVLTMYTQALLQDGGGGEPYKVTLCYPDDADPGKVDASYRDGILRVTVAKRESSKPRRIEVS